MNTISLSPSNLPDADLHSLVEANQQLLAENRFWRSFFGQPFPKAPPRKKLSKAERASQLSFLDLLLA